ncbi:MAG: hypothetical protein HFJ42_02970 [Clostridia bacterium]|nr:hypothetical protein [Clostridia bacterium]
MSESQNIEERVVTYYNDLIKNNVISGKAPVTLDWMKRQRILEGRSELDIRFGYATVDRVLGEKTPLAKAKHYLNEVCTNKKYELIPKISHLLAEEVHVSLQPNSSIREKYTSLDKEINIQVNQINDKEIFLSNTLYHTVSKILPISELEQIIYLLKTACSTGPVFFNEYFLFYIIECAYISLLVAFEEIKCATSYTIN